MPVSYTRHFKFICVHLWLVSVCLFVCAVRTNAQVKPVYDQGAIGLGQLLKRLNNTKSVMHIGAHPDDEDSDLLAYLARAENARTVYLSLTRGDGGQNVIGPELFESLGVIRSEELLQARRLDGGEQLFTRAFDYGYSKTLAEAKEKWDEQEVLCDTVRAIRSFRPLVVISRFSGTPNDGHGQHQFAGYIAPKAVKAAADPEQCKDAGAPWEVLKFYVSQGFRDTSEPGLQVNTGKYDFLLGRSYNEIASEGRSQHKTQEQGGLELKGDRFAGMNLIESKVPRVEMETSVFDGIDTSIERSTNWLRISKDKARKIQHSTNNALTLWESENPQKIIPALLNSLKEIQNLRTYGIVSIPSSRNISTEERRVYEQNSQPFKDVNDWAERISINFIDAIKLASGLQIDALTNQETVTPDETFLTSVKVFYPETSNIKVKEIKLRSPNGWEVSPAEEPQSNSPFARFFRENADESKFFNVKVAGDAEPTQPYFLEEERDGYLYRWNAAAAKTEPFQKPLISADVLVEIDGTEITFNQPVEYRYADDIRGELRRNLNVVPKVSLELDQKLIVSPRQKEPNKHKVSVSLMSHSSAPVSGKLYLKMPNGQKVAMKPLKGDDWYHTVKDWKVSPEAVDFTLKRKGESVAYEFEITVPSFEERHIYKIEAVAEIGGEKFTRVLNEIAYPHIQTHRFYTPAATSVNVLDLEVAEVKVGYIMGSGDSVPEAIRQIGLNVEMLDKKALTSGDLSKFDVIVVGIRASQTRDDFVANNERLLEYVKNGGTLIVQYQQGEYPPLAPYPVQLNARVAEEDAAVTILEPAHPVFNFPNKITPDDFENWVQERNLYAFRTFDERYTPLLEAHDTNEPENKGGMIYAEIGKGKYMYISYAFFRQLPAGVPGAYRLFANILSLPKAGKERIARK
jgi:LmbE family N-acetylglucosaminyl deacetylase